VRWAEHAAAQIEMVVVTNRRDREDSVGAKLSLPTLSSKKIQPGMGRACQVQNLQSLVGRKSYAGDSLQLSPSSCLTHHSGNKVLQSEHCVAWKHIESATLRDASLVERRSVPEPLVVIGER
jgi:hypothetical protein